MKLLFIIIYLIVLIGVPLFEYFIKRKIKNNKEKVLPYTILKGHIKIHYQTNSGMMLGLFKKKKILVIIITSIMISLLFGYSFYILFFHKDLYILKIALSLLSGGSLGNAIERYMFGYVIDYFSFPKMFIKRIRNVVFNFSDICIFIGCFLAILALIIYI